MARTGFFWNSLGPATKYLSMDANDPRRFMLADALNKAGLSWEVTQFSDPAYLDVDVYAPIEDVLAVLVQLEKDGLPLKTRVLGYPASDLREAEYASRYVRRVGLERFLEES